MLPRRDESALEGNSQERKVQVYLCGAEDDSAIVLSAAGSFLLLTAEADGHWTEAIVDAEEVLMFYDSDTEMEI